MASVNRRWLYAGLLGAAGAAGIVLLTSGGPRLSIAEGERVLLVGDSMAVGLATPLRSLAAEGKIELRVLAREGTRVADWLRDEALRATIGRWDPDVVLFCLGTNDAFLTLDAKGEAQWLEQVAALVELAAVSEADVGWVLPPELPASYAGRAPHLERLDALEGALEELSVPSFASDAIDIPRAQDHLHPTVAGYAGWAGSLWQWAT